CPPPGPIVCKPRFGAGAQATFVAPSPAGLPAVIASARQEVPDAELVLQPYVAGTAASAAFLIGPRGAAPLLPARQRISQGGRIHYEGGELPLRPALAARAVRVAQRG